MNDQKWLRLVSAETKIAGIDAALATAAHSARGGQIAAVCAVTAGGKGVVIMAAADFAAAFLGDAPTDRQIAAAIDAA